MDFWTAVVTIVAMGCGVGAFGIWSDGRRKRVPDEALERLQRAVDAHADRLASLEAIVVDGRHDLRREFDQLEAEDRPS